MSETQNFPYVTKLDILYQPLERSRRRKWRTNARISGSTRACAK